MAEVVSGLFTCVVCGAQYDEPTSFCCSCSSFGSVRRLPTRHANTLWTGTRLETAQRLRRSALKLLSSGAYPELKFSRQSLIGVYGPPGSGKTCFLLRFLDNFPETTLFASLEEGVGDSLVSKLTWLEVASAQLFIGTPANLEELHGMLADVKPHALGIDSLSHSTLTIEDLSRIAQEYQMPVIFSLHVTKAGAPGGKMSSLHLADIVISVSGRKWCVDKGRFGACEGEV